MSSPSQNQAAWRRLPIRRAPAQPIGAGSTAVDLSAYTVGAVLALVPDAEYAHRGQQHRRRAHRAGR